MNTRTRIVEIRPGEGGDDAELFAAELAAAFTAHARRHDCDATTVTGRTTIVTITGTNINKLGLEGLAGTHRVQRIPRNDRAGRRHTSTASVAVLNQHTPTQAIALPKDDIEIEMFSGSGGGGQYRNRHALCARIRHRPTGLVVVSTEHRSKQQNIDAAISEMARRLGAEAEQGRLRERNDQRRKQAKSDRAAKTWTWNQPRSEVVEHSSGRKYRLNDFMRGRFPTAKAS